MINKNVLKFSYELLSYLNEVKEELSKEYLKKLRKEFMHSYVPPCQVCSMINCDVSKIRNNSDNNYSYNNICRRCFSRNLDRSEDSITVCKGELTNFGKISIGKSIVTDINIVNISNKEYSEMKLIGSMRYGSNPKTILNDTIRAFRISVKDDDLCEKEISFILGKETLFPENYDIKDVYYRNIYLKDEYDPSVPDMIKYMINDILTSLKVTNV